MVSSHVRSVRRLEADIITVNRLNKLAIFKDLRMLSFDLRTATFSYSPGFNASITYSPNSDSYECSFFRSSTPATPATPLTASGNGDTNPHELLAALLSHRLNELTRRSDVKKGTVGIGFISVSKFWSDLYCTLGRS